MNITTQRNLWLSTIAQATHQTLKEVKKQYKIFELKVGD